MARREQPEFLGGFSNPPTYAPSSDRCRERRQPVLVSARPVFALSKSMRAIHGSNVGKRLAWESTYSRRQYEAQDGLGLGRFVCPEIGLPSARPRRLRPG